MRVGQKRDCRKVLFLQGLASPFFWRLGKHLAAAGAQVHRINFCSGDVLFWPSPRAVNFRGSTTDWPRFLEDYLARHEITDIILFGDCRYYHKIACDLARSSGIAVHVFEEGYLRPDWITLERGAANANSSLPNDPNLIRELAPLVPQFERPIKVGGKFINRAAWDVAWNVANLVFWPLFPRFIRHRPCHPLREAIGWLGRLARRRGNERIAVRTIRNLLESRAKYFALPLQLDSDYQIRTHSEFNNMGEVIERVFCSFSAHAPAWCRLVVKVHPLDNGLVDRIAQVRAAAAHYGIQHRVDVIDGGHMPTFLRRAQGVVIVNSTAGLAALQYRRPTIALGQAIFDIDGLTFCGSLDRFWAGVPSPDRELFRAFRRLMLAQTQVNGSFFNSRGIDLAVSGSAARLGFHERVRQRPASTSAEREAKADLTA